MYDMQVNKCVTKEKVEIDFAQKYFINVLVVEHKIHLSIIYIAGAQKQLKHVDNEKTHLPRPTEVNALSRSIHFVDIMKEVIWKGRIYMIDSCWDLHEF